MAEKLKNQAGRTSPLVLMTVVALVVVCALSVVLLAGRGRDRSSARDDVTDPPAAVAPAAAEPGATAVASAPPSRPAAPPPPPTGAPDAGADEEVPIWARPPRVTVTPFPEGGRYDPPQPKYTIPAYMLDPPGDGGS